MSHVPLREQDPEIRVAPFVRGAAAHGRVIVRREAGPDYLCLTDAELAVVEELRAEPVAVSDLLGRHLAGTRAIDFKAAVALLLKLHHANFIENTTEDMSERLREFAHRSAGHSSRSLRRIAAAATTLLDLPLVSFDRSRFHPALRFLGSLLVSWPAVALGGVALVVLAVYSSLSFLPDPQSWARQLAAPERLVATTFLAFSVAASLTAFLQMAALAGAGARFVGGSVRITALCVVRLAVDDQDAFVLPRAALWRYRALTLLLPWVSALSCLVLAGGGVGSPPGLFAGAFALLGVFMLCPLYRSPLVKIGEGFLATLDVLQSANSYLTSGLLRLKGGEQEAGGDGKDARQAWMAAFACVSILWLYGMSTLFFDALVAAVPDLWVQAMRGDALSLRRAAAAFVLVVLGLAMVAPLLRLVLIPVQNLAAMANMPLRRARRGIDAFRSKAVSPSAAVTNFLREIPILGDLDDSRLERLTAALRYSAAAAGQAIIRRGDPGEEFFILADGQAQVVLGDDAQEQVVDVLSPGDSFGEIALVEKVRRTATIRALTPCRLLVLKRQAFDTLFPEGSEDRARLTRLIRQVKLVLESQALSHLAPRQIRELLRSCRTVRFAAGDFMIREGQSGDCAYLVESGDVQVVREDAALEVARLRRGELVGAISLIKGIARTASVRAETDVVCLEIDKATFLRMCMSNMFVALLVADLSDRQMAAVRRAG